MYLVLDPLKPGDGSIACISSCDDGQEELGLPAEFFSRCFMAKYTLIKKCKMDKHVD